MNLRPLEWLFAWMQERPKVDARARLCTRSHVLVWFEGMPEQRVTQHVDVTLELHKPRGGAVSVFKLERAELNGEELHQTWTEFMPVTVEPGRPPETVVVPLGHLGDRPIEASVGDQVKLDFRTTHRRLRVSARVEREE